MFELKMFSTPTVFFPLLVLIAFHAISVYAKGKVAKAFGIVNIGLHLLMFVPMLDAHFYIEEAVLVYLVSFFAYTVLALLAYKREEKRKREIEALWEKHFPAERAIGEEGDV